MVGTLAPSPPTSAPPDDRARRFHWQEAATRHDVSHGETQQRARLEIAQAHWLSRALDEAILFARLQAAREHVEMEQQLSQEGLDEWFLRNAKFVPNMLMRKKIIRDERRRRSRLAAVKEHQRVATHTAHLAGRALREHGRYRSHLMVTEALEAMELEFLDIWLRADGEERAGRAAIMEGMAAHRAWLRHEARERRVLEDHELETRQGIEMDEDHTIASVTLREVGYLGAAAVARHEAHERNVLFRQQQLVQHRWEESKRHRAVKAAYVQQRGEIEKAVAARCAAVVKAEVSARAAVARHEDEARTAWMQTFAKLWCEGRRAEMNQIERVESIGAALERLCSMYEGSATHLINEERRTRRKMKEHYKTAMEYLLSEIKSKQAAEAAELLVQQSGASTSSIEVLVLIEGAKRGQLRHGERGERSRLVLRMKDALLATRRKEVAVEVAASERRAAEEFFILLEEMKEHQAEVTTRRGRLYDEATLATTAESSRPAAAAVGDTVTTFHRPGCGVVVAFLAPGDDGYCDDALQARVRFGGDVETLAAADLAVVEPEGEAARPLQPGDAVTAAGREPAGQVGTVVEILIPGDEAYKREVVQARVRFGGGEAAVGGEVLPVAVLARVAPTEAAAARVVQACGRGWRGRRAVLSLFREQAGARDPGGGDAAAMPNA